MTKSLVGVVLAGLAWLFVGASELAIWPGWGKVVGGLSLVVMTLICVRAALEAVVSVYTERVVVHTFFRDHSLEWSAIAGFGTASIPSVTGAREALYVDLVDGRRITLRGFFSRRSSSALAAEATEVAWVAASLNERRSELLGAANHGGEAVPPRQTL
jgi:hypothetical protein